MPVIEENKCKLTPVEWQAVKVLGRHADLARDGLEPGSSQPVDLLLRVQGTVDVGEDGQSARRQTPTAKALLAWLLSLDLIDEVKKPQVLAKLRACADTASGTVPEVDQKYNAQAEMAIAAVSPAKPVPRKGAIKGMLRVGVVSTEQLGAQVSGAVEKATRAIMLSEE
jgi:hypothetical protein